MKVYNVGLIGFGRMGKIYLKEINKNKYYKIINILKDRNITKNYRIINNFFESKKINLIIIASPIDTHFKYLKLAYKFKKNIIIEKPIVENSNQFRKLLTLNKNYKKKVMIHHNDVLNFKKYNLGNQFKNKKKIEKIEMIYGKKDFSNTYKKPFFDWLPHPLSIIINFFGQPKRLDILNYSKKIKKKFIIENLKILFDLKIFSVVLKFSNDLNVYSKKIFIYKKEKKQIYNGYLKKNQRTVKLLLDYFNKSKKINDIKKNEKVYKLLFEIDKLIQKNNSKKNIKQN